MNEPLLRSTSVPCVVVEFRTAVEVPSANHRSRPSLYVSTDRAKVVIDTPPEFRLQCLREKVNWLDAVSHFFVQRVEDNSVSQAKYVPFDESSFSFPLETVKARDWEAQSGHHAGGYVLDELQQIESLWA